MTGINKMSFDKTKYLNFNDDTKSIECVERFNQHKLNHIIENFNNYVPLMKEDIEKRQSRVSYDYDPLVISKTYLGKSRKGKINTTFIQKKNIGRFQALKSISLQTLPRKIRHTISSEYYNDIDVKNCHPVILEWLGKELSIETPTLTLYNNNRKEFLEEFNQTKMGVISLIYGAKPKQGSDETIYSLCNELSKIQDRIIYELYPEEFKTYRTEKYESGGKLDNITGSFMSKFLQDIENEVLQSMWSFYKNIHECILCFDGMLVPKNMDLNLEDCQQHVRNNTGIPVELVKKEMEELLPIPESISPYQELELDYYDNKRDLVKKEIVEKYLVDEWVYNTICYVECRRSYYVFERLNDEVSNEQYTQWSEMSKSDIEEDLKQHLWVINENYDSKIEEIVNDFTSTQKVNKYFKENPTHRDKVDEYIATKLFSGNKQEKGYLNDVFQKRIRASEVLKPSACIKSYRNIQYTPFLKRKGAPYDLRDTLNIWTEFPLENIPLKQTVSFEETHIYKFIKEVLCDSNEGEFNHLLDTIADIIQEPHKVKANSHFFYGRQGIGKTTFASFLSALIGNNNCVSYSNNLDGLRQFNSESSAKLVKVFEEVETKGTMYKNHNRIKGEITDKKTRSEKKHKDAVYMRNCARLFMFSNNKDGIYVEGDCRRFTFHACNSQYACNNSYYTPIIKEIEDIDLMRTIFEYFATREYEYTLITKCFDTEFKNQQKMKDLPHGIKFIVDLGKDNFTYYSTWCKETKDVLYREDKVPLKKLKTAYNHWCEEQDRKPNFQTLKTQLDKLDIKLKPRVRYLQNPEKRADCYILNKEILEETLKIYFRNPNYKLIQDVDED